MVDAWPSRRKRASRYCTLPTDMTNGQRNARQHGPCSAALSQALAAGTLRSRLWSNWVPICARQHQRHTSPPQSEHVGHRHDTHSNAIATAEPAATSDVTSGHSAKPPSMLHACEAPRRRNARAAFALRLPERQKKTTGVSGCASQL